MALVFHPSPQTFQQNIVNRAVLFSHGSGKRLGLPLRRTDIGDPDIGGTTAGRTNAATLRRGLLGTKQ